MLKSSNWTSDKFTSKRWAIQRRPEVVFMDESYRSDRMGCSARSWIHDPTASHSRLRFGCFCGAFRPSRRQVRLTRLSSSTQPTRRNSSAILRWSSRPRGILRCVERCCPSATQAQRSDTPSSRRTCSTHSRRRAGLRSSPRRPPAGSACPMLDPRPPSADGHFQPRDPSAA